MLEVAEIFRLHGPAYRQQFGRSMLPSHRRAMQDIEQCRTAARGGQLYYCDQCKDQRYSYHSCKNRHCPKCGNEQANDWLDQQQQLLLPVPHFLVTFTLPAELRTIARSNQKLIYNLLFRTAAQALLKLAQDPRFVGGQIGMVGVLHTWTRQLIFHPHVHFIVTGGGLSNDGRWKSSRPDFLVPVSNNRLVKLANGQVTFKYQESATKQIKHCTLSAQEFIHRFLQHVLPPRFIKVRYYGLLSPRHRHLLALARPQLAGCTYDPAQTAPAKMLTAVSNSHSAIDHRQSTMT